VKKKTTKLTTKKAVQKKAAAKKSSAKPKRKAQSRAELAELVERFTIIADRLAQTVDRLVPVEMRQRHTNEHTEHDDDVEVSGTIREE
jgi:hypothetical protein